MAGMVERLSMPSKHDALSLNPSNTKKKKKKRKNPLKLKHKTSGKVSKS
jgi:hypothetical protein